MAALCGGSFRLDVGTEADTTAAGDVGTGEGTAGRVAGATGRTSKSPVRGVAIPWNLSPLDVPPETPEVAASCPSSAYPGHIRRNDG